jgi:hypothetical protein
MDFYLHNLIGNTIRADTKKYIKHFGLKKETHWQKNWYECLENNLIQPDIITPIVILESAWLNNPVCLLPESKELIQQIQMSNFEGQIDELKYPYKIFTIAIPKNVQFNGQKIEGLLVTALTATQKNVIAADFSKKFLNDRKLLIGDPSTGNLTGEQVQFNVTYMDPSNNKAYITTNIDGSMLSSVMNSKTIEDFSIATTNSDNTTLSDSLNDQEKATQFALLKFVVGFIIYLSAHDKDCVKDIESIKMNGATKGTLPVQVETIRHFKSRGNSAPHYRNLRHERFYQGDYEQWKPGTRWIPVNMHLKSVEESK